MAQDPYFELMAHEMLADFSVLFYIDAETNDYRWYNRDSKTGHFVQASSGKGFYEYVKTEAIKLLQEDDRALVADYLEPRHLKTEVAPGQTRDIKFRYNGEGKLEYYTMRVVRSAADDGDDHFVIGLGSIGEDTYKRRTVQRLKDEREIYNRIARGLAREYVKIFYVHYETGRYIEFLPDDYTEHVESLVIPKDTADFYHDMQEDVKANVPAEEQNTALGMYNKGVIETILRGKRSFSYKYRRMTNGELRYHLFTIIDANDGDHFVICIKDIEDDLKAEQAAQERQKKAVSFTHIAESLASNYDVIYYVNIDDLSYVAYTSKNIYGHMEVQEEGEDFIKDSRENIPRLIHPDDRGKFATLISREGIVDSLSIKSSKELDYRMVVNGEICYTRLTVRKSSDGHHVIIGVENIDELVQKEQEQLTALNTEKEIARRDGLTGVKNKYAYDELMKSVQGNIDNGLDYLPFAIAICDLNYLKQTNDNQGHKAGDDLLKAACKIICDTFTHCPVFRIGGDEFAVFVRGEDYENREALVKSFMTKAEENNASGSGPVVAIGLSVFESGSDHKVSEVFERADSLMYENKKALKSLK